MNTRTWTLKKYIDDDKLRLSDSDRGFLSDLAKVRIIDEHDAKNHHYSNRKTPASKRLDKLVEAGILECRNVNQPGKGTFKAYEFKNQKIASLFGGKKPIIGAKRNALHEVITSKIYFAEGRPSNFTLEDSFTQDQKSLFATKGGLREDSQHCFPDAIFERDGELVVVEADSGQYTKFQVVVKQSNWVGMKQVWGQPSKASARVENATVHRF